MIIDYTKILLSLTDGNTLDDVFNTYLKYSFPLKDKIVDMIPDDYNVQNIKIPIPIYYDISEELKIYEDMDLTRIIAILLYKKGYTYNVITDIVTAVSPDIGLFDSIGKNITAPEYVAKLDPVIGRENETLHVMQILSNRRKKNPILIGDPGVGKTAIVEHLAQKIIDGDVPLNLVGCSIIELSPANLSPSKIKSVMEMLEENPSVILFIDEFHALSDGNTQVNGGPSILDIMKPYLARGTVKIIAATTDGEYRRIERDKSIQRRLQPIYVDEPSTEDTATIMDKITPVYSKYHKIELPEGSEELIRKVSDILSGFRPDKNISILDNIMAILITKNNGFPYTPTIDDVIDAIVDRYKIKKEYLISYDSSEQLGKRLAEMMPLYKDISTDIMKDIITCKNNNTAHNIASLITIVGNNFATKKLAESIATILDHNGKYLYVSGKEFTDSITYTRIKGAPPAYVGFGQTTLFSPIRNRNMPIIIDNWNIIHPVIKQLFLDMINTGHLITNDYEDINFKNVEIIITRDDIGKNKSILTYGNSSYKVDEISMLTDIFITTRSSDEAKIDEIAKKYNKDVKKYKRQIKEGITLEQFEKLLKEDVNESRYYR